MKFTAFIFSNKTLTSRQIENSMYPVELRLDFFALLILLGVFQGFFLTYFFLNKENRKITSNRLYGLLIGSMSIMILEHWLNYTGYIAQIIWIDNYSEPFNFFIAPIAFLFVKTNLKPRFDKKDLLHLIPFVLYFCYSFAYFLQTDEFKFNSFLWVNHPDWERIVAVERFNSDPLGLRSIVNDMTLVHFVIYNFMSMRLVVLEVKKEKLNFWKLSNTRLRWLRNLIFHFIMIILVFVFAKTYYGRDLGDHLIGAYTALIIYLVSIQAFNESSFFKKVGDTSKMIKYTKSSLTEEQKDEILINLQKVMQEDEYYTSNMASLPDLSKKVTSVSHHVSQVINERLGKSFFEWLAENRIEKAKSILSAPETARITIEELAEIVGYNSKSSFNKAFKKYTGQTPSQFRKFH